MQMKIGFYPGCSLKGTSREYNESVAALAKAFSLELEEVQDWNCCGATAAHSMNRTLALLLPARILALAEQQGLDEVVVPCASCYNRLSTVQYELAEDEALRNEIADTIRMPYTGSVRILNVVQMIEKYIQGELAARIVQPFDRQVACYYGCLLVRPHGVLQFDRLEDPQSLDIVGRLSGEIVRDAADRGAQAIIVACPMCHSNLDMRRQAIDSYLRRRIDVPVLYVTQAIGLAVGLSPRELGIERHFVPVTF